MKKTRKKTGILKARNQQRGDEIIFNLGLFNTWIFWKEVIQSCFCLLNIISIKPRASFLSLCVCMCVCMHVLLV